MLPGEDGTLCRVRLDIKYTPHPTREQAALGRLPSVSFFCANPHAAAGRDAYCSYLVRMIVRPCGCSRCRSGHVLCGV